MTGVAGSEFSLIETHFSRPAAIEPPRWLKLGIGDDAAVIEAPPNRQLVSTLDTLVEGRHFPESTEAASIGWKSLAVNVSDLVAMAADPAHFLLSLTLPQDDESWLARFSDGLFRAAEAFGMTLVGGDTCRGPLSISIQANGWVPPDQFVTRSGASSGDRIWLSGCVGESALGLALLQGRIDPEKVDAATTARAYTALNYPQPRTELIGLLRRHATAAIDISDGLAADLRHLLEQSGVGAVIDRSALPLVDALSPKQQLELALGGGDDYEILFTAPPAADDVLREAARQLPFGLSPIGHITESGCWLVEDRERTDLNDYRGYDHFSD